MDHKEKQEIKDHQEIWDLQDQRVPKVNQHPKTLILKLNVEMT